MIRRSAEAKCWGRKCRLMSSMARSIRRYSGFQRGIEDIKMHFRPQHFNVLNAALNQEFLRVSPPSAYGVAMMVAGLLAAAATLLLRMPVIRLAVVAAADVLYMLVAFW